VTQCYSTGAISSGGGGAGGLVGENTLTGTVVQCYSMGSVSGQSGVGGLVGNNRGTVAYSYSIGLVRGQQYAGGLVGDGSASAVTACFWDTQTSGQATSDGGRGKTTAQMRAAITFISWLACGNQGGVWTMDEGKDYPRLRWENLPGKVLDRPTYGGGAGTAQDPYLIYTAEQLATIGLIACDWDKHFKLMADIDLSGFDGKNGRPAFPLIGPDTNPATWYYDFDATPFTGAFDGNGHTISYLTITGDGYLGLFCCLEGNAEVKNLGVVDVNIAGTGRAVGALVGYSAGAVITDCYSTGVVSSAGEAVGGLVGYKQYGSITFCYSEARVSGTRLGIGGLVGQNYGAVTGCYSTGPVGGTGSWRGGLAGATFMGAVTRCYSTGAVEGIGVGLLGILGGGGVVTQCFWDTQTSGQATSAGGIGKTTVEMQMASTFLDAGWDFVGETKNGTENLWWILEGKDYPHLWWEARN
jgi:hypothetical protein